MSKCIPFIFQLEDISSKAFMTFLIWYLDISTKKWRKSKEDQMCFTLILQTKDTTHPSLQKS